VGKTNSIVDRGLGVCILAYPTEYLWQVLPLGYMDEVLGHLLRVQSQNTVVETLMTKIPASAVKDRVRVTITCGNMFSVHTTYPLCGWARSGASKRGTKPVGGSSIGAGEEGANLTFPETHGRLHSPGATSCGRMCPRPRKAGWCHGS
jgi:hypothetical protein